MFDIFKKKHNKKNFRFVGNRPHLRTEEEMSLVNKDLEPWSINIGIPCKKQKNRSRKMLEMVKEYEKKWNNFNNIYTNI